MSFILQLKEAHTLRYIFMENSALCYEVTEKVVQHIVHCVETQGRHVEYLKALQTLVKAEGQSIRKTQDMVMAEVQCLIHWNWMVTLNNREKMKNV